MNQEIKFLRARDYKFLKNIGQGGTGKTILIEDEIINEKFVCKKYAPYYEEYQELYFKNFVHEIKLLHLLNHRNIVRVFNYYLYPDQWTGYIMMEFINGMSINEYLNKNPERLNDVFTQTISGFWNLEENDILHRDIRPDNIMISHAGIVKIIDFGFGKKIDFNENFDNSVSLNWRYPIPKDFESKTYDFKTEIYFVGKLFEEIIIENDLQNFSYFSVLTKMININPEERILSFFDIERKLLTDDFIDLEFSEDDFQIYQEFANGISALFSKIEYSAEYLKNIDSIIMGLEEIYRNSMLEYFVQNNVSLARCFVRGLFYYNKSAGMSVSVLKNFIKFLKSVSIDKKMIILNNLWQRLDMITKYSEAPNDDDDLPF